MLEKLARKAQKQQKAEQMNHIPSTVVIRHHFPLL